MIKSTTGMTGNASSQALGQTVHTTVNASPVSAGDTSTVTPGKTEAAVLKAQSTAGTTGNALSQALGKNAHTTLSTSTNPAGGGASTVTSSQTNDALPNAQSTTGTANGTSTASEKIARTTINTSNVPGGGTAPSVTPGQSQPTSPLPAAGSVDNPLSSSFSVPKNGLFQTHTEPQAKYLVETDSRFTNYKSFISSDYMLQQMSYDPAKTQKRLGDGFYEQKLIRDQITELTGRRFLDGYSSDEEQYKALMNNGVLYAQALQFKVGVALSAEQMAQLTSDIVWLVEKEVEGEKVLVPVIYMAQVQVGDLKPNGALMAAKDIQILASGDLSNSGVIKADNRNQISANNITNRGGVIEGGVTELTAVQDIVNQSGSISGKDVQLVAGRDIIHQTEAVSIDRGQLSTTLVSQQGKLTAQGSLNVQAGRDISLAGAQIQSGGDLSLTAGRAIEIGAVEYNSRAAFAYSGTKTNQAATTNIVSSIQAGGNATVSSLGDITLRGTSISAGDGLTLASGGNIAITAVTDRVMKETESGNRKGKNYNHNLTDDETVIGSSLTAEKGITIAAVQASSANQGNVSVTGSTIASTAGSIMIAAANNVTIQEASERHEALSESRKVKKGFLSKKVTEKSDHTIVNEVVGSTVSGEAVTVQSGNDLTVKASNLVATNDLSLTAGNNLNLTSAAETGAEDHYKKTKKSGLFGGGGLGFTIGSKSEKSTIKEQTLGEVGSTIGSLQGNVSLQAGNQVTSQGTTIVSAKDLDITGKGVTIDNTIDTYDSKSKYEIKQSGLSVSLGGGAITNAVSAAGNIERASEVQDDRLKGLYAFKASQDIGKLTDGSLNGKVTFNVSLGSSKQTSEQTVHVETVNTSNINAGGAVRVIATAGDVTLTGVKLNAGNVAIQAAKDINLRAAQNKQQIDSKTSSSSWSVGAGINTGYTAGVSKGSGKEHENSVSNVGSVINASGTVGLQSGSDTNISGSQVKGDKVVANIGGNLNIASLQDLSDYTAKNKNSGIELSTGIKTGTTGSIGSGKTNSTYASVTEQAGIFAGTGGFEINVGKNTDLKGAVIASEAAPDKNKLSTDTLTYSDIQNKAEYDSSSVGVNYNSKLTPGMKLGDYGLTPNIGVSASGDADSTTKSAISPGTVIVRSNPNTDLSKISRDTTNTVNALGKIFDKQTVKEKQELAGLFGEVAFEEIHNISEKNGWKDGDPQKVALHTIVGALMAQMGGGDALSGGVGAGVNEAMQKELSNITDPALRQWASYVIGSTAAKVAGGTPITGGSTAVSGTKNNNLNVAVVGLVAVPGVGEVVLLAGGAILVGGLIYESGSWVYDNCVPYVISIKVPNKILKETTKVELDLFERISGNGGPPKWVGPLGWYLEKDRGNSPHGGSVWKLFNWAGERIATLAEDGKILRK